MGPVVRHRLALTAAVVLAACSSGAPLESAGAGDATPPPAATPDAALGTDGPAGAPPDAAADGAGVDPPDDGGGPTDLRSKPDHTGGAEAGRRVAQTAECLACTQDAIDNGTPMVKQSCPPRIGCAELPAPDRELCEALLECMLVTKCWDDPIGPAKCFCGTATSLACTSTANGPCKDQVLAATRATDGTQASVRLFNTVSHPASGLPAKLFTCQVAGGCRDKCTALVDR